MTTTTELRVDRGGSGEPTLLLLHGMGGVAGVWTRLLALLDKHWPGSWVAPDLPGHGRSPYLEQGYSYDRLAAAVAGVVEPGQPVAVLGHSLGGAVGLALAAGDFGVPVTGVVGVGIKVRWSEQDLAGVAVIAKRAVHFTRTREEAMERAVKAAGLLGLVPADEPGLDNLVRRVNDGWRPILDLRALTVGAPDMSRWLGTLAQRGIPAILAAGERDPMSPREHLAELVPDPVILPGLGHSVHVEDPEALLPLIEQLRG
ncbi:MAG TPA: alpha/beta hydrolase [Sporichthya sp.]|nr:alpha/beta hydrolase [Sporichthya sp.]